MANSATYNHTKIHFTEGSAPTTPDTGEWVIYAKSTGFFVMDDAGTEYGPFGDASTAATHIADTTDAHDASAVSFDATGLGNTTATEVQTALEEFDAAITSAGGGGGAVELITDTTLGIATANFDFTSIPGTYKHLRLVCNLRSDRAGNTVDFGAIRFNNDSSAIYDWQLAQFAVTVTVQSEAFGATSIANCILVPGATATAGRSGGGVIEVPDYASTTFHKFAHHQGYMAFGTSSGNIRGIHSGGTWRSTAAITRITIFPLNGTNWIAGSRVSLYGIN